MSYFYNPRAYNAREQMQNFYHGNQSNNSNLGYGRNQYNNNNNNMQQRPMQQQQQQQSWRFQNRNQGIRPLMGGVIPPLFPDRNAGFQNKKIEDVVEDKQPQIVTLDADENAGMDVDKDAGAKCKSDSDEPYDPSTATPDDDIIEIAPDESQEPSTANVTSSSNQPADKKIASSVQENIPTSESQNSSFNSMENQSAPKKELAKFTCELCLVTCSSEMNLKAHLDGARHMKNVKKQEAKPPARINAALSKITEPVLGLDHVTEFQSSQGLSEEERYLCKLCSVRGNCRVIVAHVIGYKHRTEYMRKYHHAEYVKIQGKGNTTAESQRIAYQIEQKDGRGDVAVAVDDSQFLPFKRGFPDTPPDSKRKRTDSLESPTGRRGFPDRDGGAEAYRGDNQKCSTNGSQAESDRLQKENERENMMEVSQAATHVKEEASSLNVQPSPSEGPERLLSNPESWSLSGGVIGGILQNLSKCIIKNEEDARVALHVSTCLTQSLLKYRLESMPQEILKASLSSESTKTLLKEHSTSDFEA